MLVQGRSQRAQYLRKDWSNFGTTIKKLEKGLERRHQQQKFRLFRDRMGCLFFCRHQSAQLRNVWGFESNFFVDIQLLPYDLNVTSMELPESMIVFQICTFTNTVTPKSQKSLMAPSNRHTREVVDSTTIKDFRSFWMASFLHLRLG